MMIETILAVSLLHKIVAAEDRQNVLRMKYECLELQENWDARDPAASLRSKQYEVILLEGVRYRKLVSRNGQSLSADERLLVEDDMLRTSVLRRAVAEKAGGERLATLEQTHELSLVAPNQLVAKPKGAGRLYRLTFDPSSFALVEYVREEGETTLKIEYESDSDAPRFMRRMEVNFTSGIARVQRSTFSAWRPAR